MDFSVRQLAQLLSVSRSKIYRMVREGKIPYMRAQKGKRQVIIFDKDAICQWLKSSEGRIGRHPLNGEAIERVVQCNEPVAHLGIDRIVSEIREIKREIEKIPLRRRAGETEVEEPRSPDAPQSQPTEPSVPTPSKP